MTNKIAIALGICLLAGLFYDTVQNGGANIIFLGKLGLRLIEWMAFWR